MNIIKQLDVVVTDLFELKVLQDLSKVEPGIEYVPSGKLYNVMNISLSCNEQGIQDQIRKYVDQFNLFTNYKPYLSKSKRWGGINNYDINGISFMLNDHMFVIDNRKNKHVVYEYNFSTSDYVLICEYFINTQFNNFKLYQKITDVVFKQKNEEFQVEEISKNYPGEYKSYQKNTGNYNMIDVTMLYKKNYYLFSIDIKTNKATYQYLLQDSGETYYGNCSPLTDADIKKEIELLQQKLTISEEIANAFKKKFALEQIAPYFKNPEICGINERGKCAYITPNGKMCIAGKNMIDLPITEEIAIDSIIETCGQDIFKPEARNILSSSEWFYLQKIHDAIAKSTSTLKTCVNSLGLFTYDEMVEAANKLP